MEKSPIVAYVFIISLFAFFIYLFLSYGSLINVFQNKEVSTEVILGGDVMLGRTVMIKSLDQADPSYPFRQIVSVLTGADLVYVNLENPIVENCRRDYTSMIFCADPKMIEGLKFAGINAVTLANNHSRNYGQSGLDQSISYLKENNILVTGIGELVTTQINGLKFGLLGFNFLEKDPVEADYALIKTSAEQVDVLIVSVHWGAEYRAEPNAAQKDIAQEVIKSGADIVVGHHPHWVQAIDYIEGKPVYYSLGNLVFDQMWSEPTRKGLLIKLTLDKEGNIVNEEFMNIYIDAWAQPKIVE